MARARIAAPVGDSGTGSGTRCETDVDEDYGGRGARCAWRSEAVATGSTDERGVRCGCGHTNAWPRTRSQGAMTPRLERARGEPPTIVSVRVVLMAPPMGRRARRRVEATPSHVARGTRRAISSLARARCACQRAGVACRLGRGCGGGRGGGM